MGSAHPSAAPRNLGQDGRIHTDDKAPLPVVEFWGVTAVLMAPLIPPQTSLTLIKCFLQTMALESNPRNAPHLNRKAFLSAFSFPQYLETSSVGQFTWTANICSYRSSPTMTTHNPYSFLPFKSLNPAFPNLLGGKIHQNRDQRWRVEFVL